MSKTIRIAIIDDAFSVVGDNIDSVTNLKKIFPFSHGDKVFSTICKYLAYPNKTIFDLYGIFDGYGNSSLYINKYLISIIKKNVDLIVLCLSFNNKENWMKMLENAKILGRLGTWILIAEQQNFFSICDCDNIIFLEKGFFNSSSDFFYEKNPYKKVICDTLPEIVKYSNEYFVFNGSSKGTSIFAAVISNLFLSNEYRSLKQVIGELEHLLPVKKPLVCNSIMDIIYHKEYEKYYNNILNFLNGIVCQSYALEEVLQFNLLKLSGNDTNFIRVILFALNINNINAQIDKIDSKNICCINNLITFIKG